MLSRNYHLILSGIKLDDVRGAMTAAGLTGERKFASTSQSTVSTSPSAALIDFASYSAIPRTFISIDKHPSQTNLLCWHCSLSFTSYPRFIAFSYTMKAGQQEWDIDGNFCSWSCAAAYIDEQHFGDRKWTLLFNLATVRAQADKCPIRTVDHAPRKITMSSYIGAQGMSQQAFSALVADKSRVQ